MTENFRELVGVCVLLEGTKIDADSIVASGSVVVPSETTDFAKMDDLPPEVMAMIFKKLDSVTCKKIERVCKGWQNILQRDRQLRTHILIELPQHLIDSNAFHSFWDAAVRHLVNSDLEAIHFDGGKLPAATWSRGVPRSENGLDSVQELLVSMGVQLSKVDITFSNWSLYVPIRGDYDYAAISSGDKKVRILSSEITTEVQLYDDAALYFDELWLDGSDGMAKQVSEIFFSESGPMTKDETYKMIILRQDIPDDFDELYDLSEQLPEICYLEDAFQFLDAVRDGVHVPKFTVDVLTRLIYGDIDRLMKSDRDSD